MSFNRHLISFLSMCLLMATWAVTTTQAQNLTVLHNFAPHDSSIPAKNADGCLIFCPLTLGSDGNFYGTASEGGVYGDGTLFKITPLGDFTLLHTFSGQDGIYPYNWGGLVEGLDGAFYGATVYGGVNGTGNIFKIAPNGTFTSLYSFSAVSSDPPSNAEGAYPPTGLTLGTDGNFYGASFEGGANGNGTIYKVTPAGTITVLHTFSAQAPPPLNSNSDGANPEARLIQGSDGAFYGTTQHGGAYGYGVIFRVTSDGIYSVLFHCNGYGLQGGYPQYAGLLQLDDGNLYGTMPGGMYEEGMVFQLTSGGVFTPIHSFNTIVDGNSPRASLIRASDGNLYGTTSDASQTGQGMTNEGTLFRITTDGAFTTLYTFDGYDGSGEDGSLPSTNLTEGLDGCLYGTTLSGGQNDSGTIFRYDLVPAQLLLRNPSTGQMAAWVLNGAQAVSGAYVSQGQSPNWNVVGEADLSANHQLDLLFQNASTGQLAVWLMNGMTPVDGTLLAPTPAAGWKAVGVGDFNGDGKPDLILQNVSTGQVAVWYLNGTQVTGGAYLSATPQAGWKVVGAADFNTDGSTDLVFQNANTGQLAVWYMKGVTATGEDYITPSQSPDWKCVAVRDLNKYNHPDLLFQNVKTGQLAYWLLNGTQATEGQYFSITPPAGWQVVTYH